MHTKASRIAQQSPAGETPRGHAQTFPLTPGHKVKKKQLRVFFFFTHALVTKLKLSWHSCILQPLIPEPMSTKDDLSDAATTTLSTPLWQPLWQAKQLPKGKHLPWGQASQAAGLALHSHVPTPAAMQPSGQELPAGQPAPLQTCQSPVSTFSGQAPHASYSEKRSLKVDLPPDLVQSPVKSELSLLSYYYCIGGFCCLHS